MRYSRTALIVLLVAAEVLVAGTALSILRGHMGWTASAHGLHRLALTPTVFPGVDAGAAPHVTVSVPDSRITVEASIDGQIHVTDQSSTRGNVFGTAGQIPPLRIQRTADGMAIERPPTNINFFMMIGSVDRGVRIALPPGATVEITRCTGADIRGLSGGVSVRSQDGSIRLENLTGDADLFSNDGRIAAVGIRSGRLAMESRDGPLTLDDVIVEQLTAITNDGRIRAHRLQLSGANAQAQVRSNDGSVNLHFTDAGNVKVQAHTSDGRIVVDGRSTNSEDSGATQATYTLGSGAGTLDVSTQDGTIAMTTNGAQ
ncbi:MAG: DUF4097 family beta strand repeat-containing protein [Vulcanimicrobiaceae bacterium]